MENIQYVRIEGMLDVVGIYNYNGVEKKKGNNNHKGAKRDQGGRDFTSSRCLRHEMFKDIQPRQPSSSEFTEHFVSLAASEVGLLRGYLSPNEGYKRNSPLHIADAYTADEYLYEKIFNKNTENEEERKTALIYDQGISSKPKESERHNKDGEASSDTSIFSQDNAPKRKQIFLGAINLKELQFLSLDDKDPSFRMVNQKDENDFILKLKNYFSIFNINDEIIIDFYKDISSILNVDRRGILLSQNQIRHLVKTSISRIKSIDGLKSGSSLKTDVGSLKIIYGSGIDEYTQSQKPSEFLNALSKVTFKEFYKKVK